MTVRRPELITLWVFAIFVFVPVNSFHLKDWLKLTNPRIIGGEPANIQDFPYQVSVRKRGQPYGYGHICGGSIINDRHVLTAAHCIAKPKMPDLYFVAADVKSLSKGIIYRVQNIMIHDKYKNSDPFQFDLALLRMTKSFIYGPGVSIKPISLVPMGSDATPSTNVVVAGWGRTILGNTDPEKDVSENLMKLSMQIVDRNECDRCLGNTHKITTKVVCAGTKSSSKKDASIGDSGGPLVDIKTGYQLGIVSFGDESATSLCPGVYTNLANKEVREYLDKALNS